jgi:hypothetical protein
MRCKSSKLKKVSLLSFYIFKPFSDLYSYSSYTNIQFLLHFWNKASIFPDNSNKIPKLNLIEIKNVGQNEGSKSHTGTPKKCRQEKSQALRKG